MNARLASSQPTVYDPCRWLALSVLLLAAVMDLVDVSIVNIALPTIRDDLNRPRWRADPSNAAL